LLLSGVFPAFGAYVQPSAQEQDLYDDLRAKFDKLTIPKKDVGDVLGSFSSPLVISLPCDAGSLYSSVDATIQTRLAKFDNSLSHTEGAITGGIYVWKCNISISGGKMTINCNNELMLNSDAILKSTEKDPQVKLAENLVILYHELLHGQLMIEAIKSNESWRDNTCNKPFDEDLDYSYTDTEHVTITPLQTEFASKLIKDIGGTFQVEEIAPAETSAGTFSKRIGSLYDYPEYVKNGISVSARSYNVADIKILSEKNDIIISGTLNDKTKTGIVWLYIFGKSAPEQEGQNEPAQEEPDTQSIEIPPWIRNNARWWADGAIGDSDFVHGIKYLIENGIMTIPTTPQGVATSTEIPRWIKNNARWWADGMISDSDFVLGIQHLIKNGIMRVGQSQPPPTTQADDSSERLGYVKVAGETFEKQRYQQTLVQITGKVEDFKTGTYVILTIIEPDQSSFELKGMLTNRGTFTVPLSIDTNSPSGRYAVLAKYNNAEVGMASFIVNDP
jgi:hypothetical protein